MALRDQPYLPLYVQDYLTDEKLSLCSWSSQGVYIKLLCLLHKSDPYGVILLKQNEKQNIDTALNFAKKISKLLPIESESLYNALTELIDEGCLIVEDDKLYQKRMVRDNLISIKRAESGKIGGNRTQKNAKAKIEANAENENINEDVNEDVNNNRIDFDVFWNLYNKKVGAKEKCRTKWNKLKIETQQKIIDSLPVFISSIREKQYQPFPETYLNQERWNDEIIKNEPEKIIPVFRPYPTK